jgi:hypothetical protein
MQRWLLPDDVLDWRGFRQGNIGVQWEGAALWLDDCHTSVPRSRVLIWRERD